MVVVYKIDRLSRSLADFAKLVEVFDRNGVTFVSVMKSFNTTTSMRRLTLNILLSFAQFERGVTAERIRGRLPGHEPDARPCQEASRPARACRPSAQASAARPSCNALRIVAETISFGWPAKWHSVTCAFSPSRSVAM